MLVQEKALELLKDAGYQDPQPPDPAIDELFAPLRAPTKPKPFVPAVASKKKARWEQDLAAVDQGPAEEVTHEMQR